MANKTLFWSFYVSFCAFCASLRLTRTVFSRLLKKAISMALWVKASLCGKSSLLEQSMPRTPSRPKTSVASVAKNPFNQRNPRLINDLHACKVLYNCRDIITFVVSPLQIRPFMQNKANFRKSQMNVNKVLTKDYEKRTLGERGKKQSQTNPNKANLKKAKMNVNKVLTKDYEKISNWAICENKPNSNPKRTQSNPISEAKK